MRAKIWEDIVKQQLHIVKSRIGPTLQAIPITNKEWFYLQWHITDQCNLRCKHCYTSRNVRDLSLGELKIIFDKFLQTISKWEVAGDICLTGGEPLCRDDFFEFLEYIFQRWQQIPNFRLSLMTNGTTITQNVSAKLSRFRPMLSDIQVSIDGARAETHDKIRGEGTFEKSLQSLQLLNKQNFSTSLHFVVHKVNYLDAFKILEVAEKSNVFRVTISRLVPIGQAEALPMLSPAELKKLWVYLSKRSISTPADGSLLARGRCDLWHLADIPAAISSLGSRMKGDNIPDILHIGQRCPVGFGSLTLDADGTVFPCRRLPIPIGNIRKDSFFKIWYGAELLWKFRYKEKFMQGKCQACPFLQDSHLRSLCCGGSPCIAYGYYNDCFMADPQCWFNPYANGEIKGVQKWKGKFLT